MKACVLHGVGDLRYQDAPCPVPRAGEVRVRVAACGVCGSDIPRIFVKGTYRFPLIPGHEFAGTVEATGEGADPALTGTRVAVFPLLPCRKCPMCAMARYALCEDYGYLGSRCDGAFAEYVCAPVWNLVPVPEQVSFEQAAMTEPAAVAAHALRQGRMVEEDCVLVLGAGPIGLMIAMWARLWGARRVILADIDPLKLDFTRTLGFNDGVDVRESSADAAIRALSGGGPDLVIEASGSAAAFEKCMIAARPFGRVVLMGNPAGEMRLSQHGYWAVLRKELTVTGTWNSIYGDPAADEWRLALECMASGQLPVESLITHRVPLADLPASLRAIRGGEMFSNKVLAVMAEADTSGA